MFSIDLLGITIDNTLNFGEYVSKLCKRAEVRTVNYGTETMRYSGPKIWVKLPPNINESKFLNEFKTKIKNGNLLTAHADYVNNLFLT